MTTMKLSVSCRIAEGFLSKEQASMSFEELADLAVAAGYQAICMRASQVGVQSSRDKIQDARRILDDRGLGVSMISGDFDIVYNNDRGPACLRNIRPYLDLAEALGAPLIRVCIKQPDDIPYAQDAADTAAERGFKIVHQCHVQSLFEKVDDIVKRVREIDRPNFGLIFEAANLEQCGQDYGVSAIEQLAPWIENVYLQNQRLSPTGSITLQTRCSGPVSFDVCEIHESGGIDFATVFDGLRQVGYDGPVTVHQSAPEDSRLTAVDAATQTARFLRQIAPA
jgi:sugar phosphate isomerase/epimerase